MFMHILYYTIIYDYYTLDGMSTNIRYIIILLLCLQVDIFWDIGQLEKARSASTSAKNWAVASIICGLGIMAAVIFISTLVVFANRNNNYS